MGLRNPDPILGKVPKVELVDEACRHVRKTGPFFGIDHTVDNRYLHPSGFLATLSHFAISSELLHLPHNVRRRFRLLGNEVEKCRVVDVERELFS